MKTYLLIFAMILGCAKEPEEPVRKPKYDSKGVTSRLESHMLSRTKLAQDADEALGYWIKNANEVLLKEADKLDYKAERLQARGQLSDAFTVRELAAKYRTMGVDFSAEWQAEYKGFITRQVMLAQAYGRECPELYAPMQEWLREWYGALRLIVDEKILVALHLDDLQVFNEGTPVVLRLKKMGDNIPTSAIYSDYFLPWTSMVSYWLTYAGCEAACWGLDVSLLCGPIAMAAEELVFRIIAPRWSDRFYEIVYK